MKKCSKCGVDKSEDSFYKDNQNTDGRKNSCKDCYKVSCQNWRIDNIEQHSLSTKQWRQDNRKYHVKLATLWNLAHPEKVAAKNAKHRSKKLKATPKWAESEKLSITELYKLARRRTKETGIKYHVDHIVPLTSDIVQGFHCLANLQVIEAKVNIIKGNRVWPDMP